MARQNGKIAINPEIQTPNTPQMHPPTKSCGIAGHREKDWKDGEDRV